MTDGNFDYQNFDWQNFDTEADWSRDMTESVPVTDVISRQILYKRTISEIMTSITDVISRRITFKRKLVQTHINMSSTIRRKFKPKRTISESIIIGTDILTNTTRHLYLRTIQELGIIISDKINYIRLKTRTITAFFAKRTGNANLSAKVA